MSETQNLLRQVMSGLAGESTDGPPPGAVTRRARQIRRRRAVTTGIAALAVTGLAAGVVGGLLPGPPAELEPVRPVPVVIDLPAATTDLGPLAPVEVPARFAVTVSGGGRPSHGVVLVDRTGAMRTELHDDLVQWDITADGATLLQWWCDAHSRLDLASGQVRDMPSSGCMGPSTPDGQRAFVLVAGVPGVGPGENVGEDVGATVVDADTGKADRPVFTWGDAGADTALAALSPDGVAAVGVMPRNELHLFGFEDGRKLGTVPGVSPQGTAAFDATGDALLVYRQDPGETAVVDITDLAVTSLPAPEVGATAQGWWGERVVWLTGDPGSQRLVTTTRTGDDPAEWVTFRTSDGTRVERVSWPLP